LSRDTIEKFSNELLSEEITFDLSENMLYLTSDNTQTKIVINILIEKKNLLKQVFQILIQTSKVQKILKQRF
jgi:hypothetical protein